MESILTDIDESITNVNQILIKDLIHFNFSLSLSLSQIPVQRWGLPKTRLVAS